MPGSPRRDPENGPSTTETSLLETSLLASSPPDGTELRQANTALFNVLRRSSVLDSLIKRYIIRAASAFEKTYTEYTRLRKENAEQQALLEVRKEHKKRKRIALKGQFVFNTKEILEIVEKAEAETAKKTKRKRRRIRSPNPEISEDRNNEVENVSSESESDCIIVT